MRDLTNRALDTASRLGASYADVRVVRRRDESISIKSGRVEGVAMIALDGIRTDAAAVDGADLAADERLRFIAGDRAEALAAIDAGGATIVPESLADRFGLGVGEVLAIGMGERVGRVGHAA